MKITGTITRVNYHNKNNGYTVALLTLNSDDYSNLHNNSHFIGNKLTVVGNFDRLVLPDEEYTFDGGHLTHQGYVVVTDTIKPVLKELLNKNNL